MTVSSRSKPDNVLARLRADHIAALLDILRTTKLRQTQFVESLYRERALHFAETLQFLQEIGWVNVNQDQLELTAGADSFHAQPTQSFLGEGSIIDAIVESDGPYQKLLAGYLAQFHTNGRQVICRPSAQSRLQHGNLRNLLMQFGMVSYQPADDSYLLHEHSAHLYFWAKNSRGATSKKQLQETAKRRDVLGSAAEAIIFEYEKKRVRMEFASFVNHVSAKNPGACYDIKSLSINGDIRAPRFIEVKAVPADSFQFFWSSAELEVASILRETYFLYLLPALGGGRFDLTRMEIISDPYTTIYQNPEHWSKEENVIVCRRKLPSGNQAYRR